MVPLASLVFPYQMDVKKGISYLIKLKECGFQTFSHYPIKYHLSLNVHFELPPTD